MRICCFLGEWRSGGIESFLTGVILHLPRDARIDIAAKRIGESVFTAGLKAMGVRFFELSGRSHSLKNTKCFAELLKNEKYDAVHLNIFHALDLIYAKIAKKYNVKVRIAHAHGAGLQGGWLFWLKMLIHRISQRFLLRYATLTLSCSESAAKFVLGKAADGYVKNGIDAAAFEYSEQKRQKIRRELSLEGKIVVGHVGRLSSEKNQAFAIEVLRELRRFGCNATLLLVGEGDDRDKLYELAEQAEVNGAVVFYGTTEDVCGLYSAMDIFIFPSLFEGFGIAVLEAECSGLPVICSDGVPSEAIVCNNAVRLSLADGAAVWAERMLEMLREPKARKSQSTKILAAGYDISRTAREMTKYYAGP